MAAARVEAHGPSIIRLMFRGFGSREGGQTQGLPPGPAWERPVLASGHRNTSPSVSLLPASAGFPVTPSDGR